MNRIEYNSCVDKYSDILYRFILKATNDIELSEDIVQDSFITLWERVDGVIFEKAKSYLFTTAYRKMVDQYRRNKRNLSLVDVGEVIDSNETTNFDLSEQLDRGLRRLSEIQRSIILLRDYEGYSYEEIGEITNLSDSQVKVYLFRARNKLRSFIMRKEVLL